MAFEQQVEKNQTGRENTTRDTCKMLGQLSKSSFCAVKALSTKCIYGKAVLANSVTRVDTYGRESKIDLAEIQRGDTVRLGATVSNMLGGPEKTGMLTITDIKDAQFDSKTGEFVIEGSNFCITNIDCSQDMKILSIVIADPDNWVTKDGLIEMTSDLTLSDYEFAINRMIEEPELSLDGGLNDLFENHSATELDEWGMGDIFGVSDSKTTEIGTPELIF